jgi:predicted GNAT family N-acyltransferase
VIVRRATLDQILPLRHAVLRPGRPLETARFDGDDEPRTVHVAAVDGDAVVGCATLVRRALDGEDAAQVRGMATRADLVRRGIGSAVLAFAEHVAVEDWGVRLLWCNARVAARAFYERAGWRVVSTTFDIADVGPHVRMVRRP